ncbi:helix-turn-helix domain-containing protein [Mycolicibacterium hassiacum]|uniref:helix-turn-helix domain-containing protein n=1 Tax=Mycolicibacterium hassiacum TaxID=46351 RepID=UPI0023F8D75C|nr:helix-turn-helix transcriptional regulator [Mycolicibacterium hassiacum]
MTTKDIAVALFVSPKTVESNLTRIYRKLRIRTRAELGRLISDAAARELGSHQPARTRR